MKKVFGYMFVCFGLLVVGSTLDDLMGGEVAKLFSNLTFSALACGGGVLLIRSARQTEKRRLAGQTANGQLLLQGGAFPVEALVLRAARAQKGRITPAEVAAATALPYTEAKEELERLTQSGACTVVVGEGGLVVYRFPEFEGDDAKREAI